MKLCLLLCLCVTLEDALRLYSRTRIACKPLALKNGRVRYRQKSGFAQYQCHKGYLLAGEKYSKCVNEKWDSPQPKCVRATCQKIKPPLNGFTYPSHRGAVLNFFCKAGYELKGPNMTSCDGLSWDTYLPACLPSNVTASLTCDFETDDLCGWSHDLNHNFDWTRLNFRTPSGHIGTGPTYDHTKGEGNNGYYMYIESSTRNINDTARLISPVYAHQDSNVCLTFYYHMYGATTGDLRVYVKKTSETWDLRPDRAVFAKSGNHGNQWLRAWLNLGDIDDDFQVIFEGVRGISYSSDIAIDDVKIIEDCLAVSITTESDSLYTGAMAYESCENRCDTTSTAAPTVSFQVSCDCDDACTERNTCCPDYIPICILDKFVSADSTTDYSTDDTIVVTNTTNASESVKAVTIEIERKRISSSTATNAATTSILTAPTTTTTVPPTLPATTTSRRTTPTVPAEPRTAPTEPRTTQTLPRVARTSTSLNTTTITKQTTPPSTTFTLKTTTAVTSPPPTATTKKLPKTKIINDIATLPDVTDEEVSVPIMIVTTNSTTETYEYVPNYDGVNRQVATIKEMPKVAEGKSVTVTVISVCLVIVGVLCVIFIARRYSRNSCLRLKKKMKSGNGDSQSDVRFLTGDEILDFTLATPDGYNTL